MEFSPTVWIVKNEQTNEGRTKHRIQQEKKLEQEKQIEGKSSVAYPHVLTY